MHIWAGRVEQSLVPYSQWKEVDTFGEQLTGPLQAPPERVCDAAHWAESLPELDGQVSLRVQGGA